MKIGLACSLSIASKICPACIDIGTPVPHIRCRRDTFCCGSVAYHSPNPTDLPSQRCPFHETAEYEWLYNFNLFLDLEELNPRLTEWLVEYNLNRPHQSLGYLPPIEYIERKLAKMCSPVLPMWSATRLSINLVDLLVAI